MRGRQRACPGDRCDESARTREELSSQNNIYILLVVLVGMGFGWIGVDEIK